MEMEKKAFCLVHGELTEENAYVCITARVKAGYRLRCKKCARLSDIKRYEKNKEQYIAFAKEYSVNNREAINRRRRQHRKENPEKYKEDDKNRTIRRRALMTPESSLKQTLRKRKLTIEKYAALIQEQNNKCAICNMPETKRSTRGDRTNISPLAIDHCHTIDKVRGLLCRTCNLGIGGLKDSIELLQSAITYLKKHE